LSGKHEFYLILRWHHTSVIVAMATTQLSSLWLLPPQQLPPRTVASATVSAQPTHVVAIATARVAQCCSRNKPSSAQPRHARLSAAIGR
jgi:hypothetical protein